ncbi:hypothetical protein PENVUL_c002G01829 [Penicillium vulpinum]|uniref:Uncharacterized protein n=1 Tax=Penicillium vulpinum TaxID=29845 RepID=A0A1V6SC47_9EURO|nr:hypothetical protein PENVUL_c002G01829 [Penicillium vulpinum]
MASRRKSTIFRVTGLIRDPDQTDEQLQAALEDTLVENLSIEERSCIQTKVDIVPSCYESDAERVALVHFQPEVPQFLSELEDNPEQNWQIEMGEADINIDRNFFGFTQLYAPQEDKPVTGDWGTDTLLDYGRSIMEEIKKIRNSFGGIILAHCLVKAIQAMKDDNPAIASLYQATYATIFFATPHKGMIVDDIKQMLTRHENHPRQHLVEQISNKSDILVHQLVDFKNLIGDRKVVSFYETGETRQLQFNEDSKRWGRTGNFIKPVDDDSALLQLPDSIEVKISVDRNHSDIVKFDARGDRAYASVLQYLREFEKDAQECVKTRFSQQPNRPKPSSTVPFKRDTMFIGREDIIEEIEKRFQAMGHQHERVALQGLAGVGKSQIAIEYSYRVRHSKPDTWVFWVHMSNSARFNQGYEHIAGAARIPKQDDSKASVNQLVHRWLCDMQNGPWLMIVDNADDESILTKTDDPEGTALVDFLPQVPHGSILFTSRNLLAAQNLTENNVIEVEPMGKTESISLLRSKTHTSQSSEDEEMLVHALEYVPLAITQAGSYIAARSTRMTVAKYLELFHESEKNQKYLLNHKDAQDLRRDPSIPDAVITTWELSFEQIRRDRSSAADLLALMSMFDRHGIPEDLVRIQDDTLQFEDDLAPLISFSLIREEKEQRSFDMHRLVQLSVQRWLEIRKQLNEWREKSKGIMAQMFPYEDYKEWSTCQKLLPHAKKVIEYISLSDTDRINMAKLVSKCGGYLIRQGAHNEAEVIFRRGLTGCEQALGPNHPDTLTSVNNLGTALKSQGKYLEAEVMYQRALAGREAALGPNHPGTLASVNDIGTALRSQGKYVEAEAIHRRALEGRNAALGPNHPDTLTSVNNLGVALEGQGKYVEAEAIYRRALAGREEALGSNHPDTLLSVNNVGIALRSQGKYTEAEAIHRQALVGREALLGPNHPDILTTVDNIGAALRGQRKYTEAEAIHRRALVGREAALGPNHPDTLFSVNNLGVALERQGKYTDAEAMHRRALAGREALGPHHPDTLYSVNNLGVVLERQGKYAEAEAIHRRALVGREEALGPNHPDTLFSVNNIGAALRRQGKFVEAEAIHRRALAGREEALGSNHPDTLSSVNNLGVALERQGKYVEAEAMYRRALAGREALGPKHPDTLFSVNNLGVALGGQGKYIEAEAIQEDLNAMVDDVKSVQTAIQSLLDLKQNEATIIEAQATRRQSDSVMAFTLVTIVFLPGSFMASLFALNVSEFPHEGGSVTYKS